MQGEVKMLILSYQTGITVVKNFDVKIDAIIQNTKKNVISQYLHCDFTNQNNPIQILIV